MHVIHAPLDGNVKTKWSLRFVHSAYLYYTILYYTVLQYYSATLNRYLVLPKYLSMYFEVSGICVDYIRVLHPYIRMVHA